MSVSARARVCGDGGGAPPSHPHPSAHTLHTHSPAFHSYPHLPALLHTLILLQVEVPGRAAGESVTAFVPFACHVNHSPWPHCVRYGRLDPTTQTLDYPAFRPCKAGQQVGVRLGLYVLREGRGLRAPGRPAAWGSLPRSSRVRGCASSLVPGAARAQVKLARGSFGSMLGGGKLSHTDRSWRVAWAQCSKIEEKERLWCRCSSPTARCPI